MSGFLDTADYEVETKRRFGKVARSQRTGIAQQLVAALRDGYDIDELASELDMKPHEVKGHLVRAGVQAKDVMTREDRFRRGLFGPLFRATDAQAAEVCGISVSGMRNWRIKHDIPINAEVH